MKRLFDLIVAISALAVLALPLLVLYAMVRRQLGSPVLFRQVRPGLRGRPFMMVKFRTMTDERGPDGELLPDARRLTAFGRFMRASSLDELPELWNVLRGEMSLVGPRPIVQDEVAKYGTHFELYTKVRPGLSGLWQVSGRNDVTYGERVALDCYYVRNWSVWLDLVVLARTVRVVLLGKGAY